MWTELAAAGGCEADVDGHRTRAAHCRVKHAKQKLACERVMTEMPYPFELVCERLCGFNEFSFFVLVAVFDLEQLGLQLSL